MRYRRSRTDIVPALPSPGSSRVREPLCADDGASVDADARLSSVPSPYSRCRTAADITACLGDPVGNCGSPIGVHAGRCPCGGRKCGVDLSVENVDRPRPDQQRRSVLPAGVPSTSSTGHPRGACRDKAQRRGSASGHDSRVLDAETERHGALCTPGNPITCAVRTPPQAPRGGVHLFFPSAMPHRYSTVAHLDLAAIRPLPPDLNGHPTLRLWSHVLLTSGDRRPTGAIGDRLVGCSPPSGSAPGAPPEGEARTRLEVVADKLAPSLRWATAEITRIATSWSADGRRPARRVVTRCGWVTGSV